MFLGRIYALLFLCRGGFDATALTRLYIYVPVFIRVHMYVHLLFDVHVFYSLVAATTSCQIHQVKQTATRDCCARLNHLNVPLLVTLACIPTRMSELHSQGLLSIWGTVMYDWKACPTCIILSVLHQIVGAMPHEQ